MQAITQYEMYMGVVEDIMDPKKCGRVRVRVIPYHAGIPVEGLPWHHSVVNNSASSGGNGNSATGYKVGSLVVGFFLDRDHQDGFIIGAFTGAPDGGYDMNALGGTGKDHWIKKYRDDNRITGVEGAGSGSWSEPKYNNNSQYPYNDVYQGVSGITREYDNTPGHERIHEIHPSGSYREIDASGTQSTKIVGDNYEIVIKDNKMLVGGDLEITVQGDANILVNGDCNSTVQGDHNHHVSGNYNLSVDGSMTQTVQGVLSVGVQSAYNTSVNGVTSLSVQSAYNISVNGVMSQSVNGAYLSSTQGIANISAAGIMTLGGAEVLING